MPKGSALRKNCVFTGARRLGLSGGFRDQLAAHLEPKANGVGRASMTRPRQARPLARAPFPRMQHSLARALCSLTNCILRRRECGIFAPMGSGER